MPDLSVVLDEKVKQSIQEPKQWKVIMLNDNHTPMEFVVGLLIELFRHTPEQAQKIMLQIHTQGSGVAGVYTFEVAEVKSIDATTTARANGYPLQIKIECEE